MEIPVVENLTFLSCAEAEDTPIRIMRIPRTGTAVIRISTPFDQEMFTTETQRGKAATKEDKTISRKERKVRKHGIGFVGATPRGCPSDTVVNSGGDNQGKNLREPRKL
jgi:hypothetical protein